MRNPFKRSKPKQTLALREFQTTVEGSESAIKQARLSPPDASVRIALRKLRAKSREEVRQNPLGRSIILAMTNNVLGAQGIQLRSRAEAEAKKALESAWRVWGKTCGFGGINWRSIQRQVLYSLIVDGEAFVQFGVRNGSLAVKVRDAQTIDPAQNELLPRGSSIRMGIEYTPVGEIVAYHFREPFFFGGIDGGETYQYPSSRTTERIPANRILHIYDREVPGTTRGVPWLIPSLIAMELLRHYAESAKIAARTAASVYGVISNPEGEHDLTEDQLTKYTNSAKLKPGGLLFPPEGYNATITTPTHPTTTYAPFTEATHREIAAGLGIAAHTLDGNLSGINFSAGRIGSLNERETFASIRQLLVDDLHDPVFAAWLPIAFVGGLPGSLEELADSEFVGKAQPHIQPREAATADRMYFDMKAKTLSEIIRDRGADPRDVFQEAADEIAIFEELGLAYPTATAPPRPQPESDDDDGEESEEDSEGNNRPPAAAAGE